MAVKKYLCTLGGTWGVFGNNPGPPWHCRPYIEPDPPPPPTPPDDEETDPDHPDLIYTIDFPNFTDIVRIPALENGEIRQRRMIRMKTRASPIPEPLQWIPSVINHLDDVEDFLIVALTLAKPILRRLPLRFIPYVGWLLAIDDVINLTNLMLGTALGGRSFKRATLKSVERMVTRRGYRVKAVSDFLTNTRMLPFLLQAGQVTQSLTGYGLSLGAIMAFTTDAFWGTLRAISGERIVIRNLPNERIVYKAAKVLSQSPQMAWMYDVLTPNEHKNMLLANALASQYVAAETLPELVANRSIEAAEMPYPLYEPWNPASLLALAKEEIEFTTDPKTGSRPYAPFPFPYPPIGDVILAAGAESEQFEFQMQNVFGRYNVEGLIANMAHIDHTLGCIEHMIGPGNLTPIFHEKEIDAYHSIEYGVFPKETIGQESFYTWMEAAHTRSLEKGLNHASFEDLKTTAIETIGGFQRGPFATFPGA